MADEERKLKDHSQVGKSVDLTPVPQCFQNMISAIELEIAEIRRRGGSGRIGVRGGRRAGLTEGGVLYEFVVDGDVTVRDETPLQVVVGERRVKGTVVSLREGVLLVALEEDLGPAIPAASLISDDSFLLQRLRDRLDEVRQGKVAFNSKLAGLILGVAVQLDQQLDRGPGTTSPRSSPQLNPEQNRAVELAVKGPLTFIWGPPGTGKTTTIARVVEVHYREGRSVLLVSNTNIAVDNALEHVARRLAGDDGFKSGSVLRFGPVVKDELRARFGPQVIPEQVVARLAEPLHRELGTLRGRQEQLKARLAAQEEALRKHESFQRLRQRLKELADQCASLRSGAEAARVDSARHDDALKHLRVDLERALGMNGLHRLFSGLSPKRLRSDIHATEARLQVARSKSTQQEGEAARKHGEHASLGSELAAQREQIAQLPSEESCRAEVSDLRRTIGRAAEQIALLERQIQELERDVLRRCRVMATTAYRPFLQDLGRAFDVVVIDEASMLMLPMAFHSAGLAQQSVTVAGDFRQLEAIVSSSDLLAKEWLSRDAFEAAGIPEQIAQGHLPGNLSVLRTQYRMRQPICDLVNDLSYRDNPLNTAQEVRRRHELLPRVGGVIQYVDTACFCPWAARRAGSHSRYNLLHALLTRNLCSALAEDGRISKERGGESCVGVVSPYAAQTRLLQALLRDRLGERPLGFAATVHRFQGNEKSLMLVELTDSMGAPLGRFMKAMGPQDAGARLLNVALSRARDQLIVIANFEYLRRNAPTGGVVHRLLDHLEAHGEALDVTGLLPLGDRVWVDGLKALGHRDFELPADGAGVFNEATFYPAFRADLRRAERSAVILSPFMTESGTSRWVDELRAVLERGAAVRIVTRPADEPGQSELVRSLRALGITVDLFRGMHEKIAVFDDTILWHGSLNVLSHGNTTECMFRISGPHATRVVVEFVQPRLGGDGSMLVAAGNPPCPKCSGATVLQRAHDGPGLYECEGNCGGRVTPGRGPGDAGAWKKAKPKGKPGQPCPDLSCKGVMVPRTGKFGGFLGCSAFPRCKKTMECE